MEFMGIAEEYFEFFICRLALEIAWNCIRHFQQHENVRSLFLFSSNQTSWRNSEIQTICCIFLSLCPLPILHFIYYSGSSSMNFMQILSIIIVFWHSRQFILKLTFTFSKHFYLGIWLLLLPSISVRCIKACCWVYLHCKVLTADAS